MYGYTDKKSPYKMLVDNLYVRGVYAFINDDIRHDVQI
jgi:hypothetical protein